MKRGALRQTPEAEGVQPDLPFEFRPPHPGADGRILLCGQVIDYALRRSHRRRAITLIVDERGLRVCAPWRATPAAIESEMRKHTAWILRKHAEWAERRPRPCIWRDGETLMLLGEALHLTLYRGQQPVYRHGERLYVAATDDTRPEAIADLVRAWMRQQALEWFRARVACHVPVLGVAEPEVRLSNARTRWGSCHAAGRIRLHWRLIQMPPRLADYVVVHELAHLREMNHSPRFWRIVAGVLPDYKALRMEIRTGGLRYAVL